MDTLLQREVSNGSGRRSHALLLPYPAQGHINPLLQLGKRLAAQGVRVTVATMVHLHAKLQRAQDLSSSSGSQQQPISGDLLQLTSIEDGLPADFERDKWTPALVEVVDCTLQEGALGLIHMLAAQGRPVTCIVGDFFLRWTSSLAQRAALPEFVFWPQCASTYSVFLHVDGLVSAGYDPYEANGFDMAIHPADLPFESPVGKSALEWLRELLAFRFTRIGKAHGVIVNSFEALEPQVFKALNLELQQSVPHPQYGHNWPRCIKLVGPLVPSALVREEKGDEVSGTSLWQEEVEECRQWLDQQPAASVLFVAFGSFAVMEVEQVRELALGLAASSQRFLWVIRDGAVKAKPLQDGSFDTAAYEGKLEEALPEGFMQGSLGKVVRWAPQPLVLRHPAVGGFFSHCGWNSTLEAVCAGVPILGWPWMMDQVTNCWLVSHLWQVGLPLLRHPDNTTSQGLVHTSICRLMQGPTAQAMRARALHLSDLARHAALNPHPLVSLVDRIHELASSTH
ncbi:hypothetical protein L7F22_056967 [Adiantum nelumboides]|nr:hypothetical protein [Adiantum nelumboides]